MLSKLAADIREWIKPDAAKESVQDRVRECVEQKLASAVDRDDDPKYLRRSPWDLLPLPPRELSLPEKCTILAVIHDQTYSHNPVNPWQTVVQELESEDLKRGGEPSRHDDAGSDSEGKAAVSDTETQQEHHLAMLYHLLERSLDRVDGQQLVGVDELLDEVRLLIGEERGTAVHADDFRSVNWFGERYEFTPIQAACVKFLWEHWEQKTPAVGQDTILVAVESSQQRLDYVFNKGDHPAWNSMIVSASTKGAYQLSEPT